MGETATRRRGECPVPRSGKRNCPGLKRCLSVLPFHGKGALSPYRPIAASPRRRFAVSPFRLPCRVPRRSLWLVAVQDFEITHLYISPGHNFFGHQRNQPSAHPVLEVPSIWCVAGKGIEGDRFFDYKDSYKGQITFFEEEAYDDLCARLGIWDRPPSVFRRNVITRGVRLNELIGKEFVIGDVRLFGTEESRPCFWMDRAFGPGAEAALKGRGGLRATILATGRLTAERMLVRRS
jgi:MOSC domain-containing protein YiiM